MNYILLTQTSTPIIGQVAWLLGKIMEAIFAVIDFIGIPNIGLAIILFTIVINLLMMPITIKQQKFSKLSAKMNPEIQAIQAKYKNKKDNASVMAQNQEVQAVYAKYGVSPTGSCLYLLIQMPILFALYRVIYAIPAYVGKVGNVFRELAVKILDADKGAFLLNPTGVSDEVASSIASTVSMYGSQITKEGGNVTNGIIDVLNKLSSADMSAVSDYYNLADVTYNGELILSNADTTGLIDRYNNFLGLNMGNSPSYMIKEALETGAWLIVIGALMIPILSALTQWINTKLMPQPDRSNQSQQASSMASSMKMMNTIMPLMSAFFCFTLPSGMGLYWIAGSVVRSVQQVVINKHIDKMNFDELIEKNSSKNAKKLEKMKETQDRLNAYANMNTKSIQKRANIQSNMTEEEKEEAMKQSTEYYNSKAAKPGSMMSKANMVRDFNEKNNKNNK